MYELCLVNWQHPFLLVLGLPYTEFLSLAEQHRIMNVEAILSIKVYPLVASNKL